MQKVVTAWIAAGALTLLGMTQDAGSVEASRIRVGVFDSRAVAVAYAASERFEAISDAERKRYEQAQESGDDATVKAIDDKMRASQARMHKQGFSTAPIDDILDVIAAELPDLARRADVEVLMNKWRVAFQGPDVELVDMTELLVNVFEPEAKTLENITALVDQNPLPLYGTDWAEFENH